MKKKIAYFYTKGRKSRLKQIREGREIPKEFFLGYFELQKRVDFQLDMFEISDFKREKESRLRTARVKRENKRSLMTSCYHLLDDEKIKELNNYDYIVAATEYIAFGLLKYYERDILNPGLFVCVMGMMSKINFTFSPFKYRRGIRTYKRLLKYTDKALFLGNGEIAFARKILPEFLDKFVMTSFFADHDFWTPGPNDNEDSYILFLGNDSRRDFDLLSRIPELDKNLKYRFITRHIFSGELPSNVSLIKGDWKEQILDDTEIREQIRNASLVIIPIVDTFQPSGQSVCLQSMACGKTVLISDFDGFWEKENYTDGEDIVFIRENTSSEWVKAINHYLESHKNIEIGQNARKNIEKKYKEIDFINRFVRFLV